MPDLTNSTTITAAVGTGAVGGVFLAFSAFVLAGLRQLSDAESVRAMQAINRTAVTPVFMIFLFGSAVVCVVAGVLALRNLDHAGAKLTLAGAIIYLVLCIVVTIAGNVPLNDTLAKLDTHGAGVSSGWHDFIGPWTVLNHIRTVGCLVACLLFVLGARSSARADAGSEASAVASSSAASASFSAE